MKKLVKMLCSLTIVMVVLLSGTLSGIAFAGTVAYEDECDLVFRKAMEEIISEESVTAETIKVIKEPVYDLSLEQLGFIYIMQYDAQEGFALVINTEGTFDVTEFYMEAISPYAQYDGQNVYVNLMLYLVWQDDSLIETGSGAVLNVEALALLEATAFYSAGSSFEFGQEVIYYTNRTENYFELAKRHPCYYPVNLSNACVPAAGGNIIGFYTRYHPQLIPGFAPGSYLLTYYLYKECPVEADAVIATLYNYMGTNVGAPGTNIAGFKNGMTKYANEKGLNISYTSCMQSGSFNYNNAKQRLESGLPVVLFVDTFMVTDLINGTGKETSNYVMSNTCHAMAGFGYSEVTYNLTSGQIRTDRYIVVATGLIEQKKGYFNTNYNTQIDECYAISIY